VGELSVGRVRHVIGPATIVGITPNVVQVEPMSYLVGGRPAQVERRGGRARRAEGRGQNDHAIGLRWAAGELSVTEDAAAQVTYPDVKIVIGGTRLDAAGIRRFHPIVGAERCLIG